MRDNDDEDVRLGLADTPRTRELKLMREREMYWSIALVTGAVGVVLLLLKFIGWL